MTAAPVVGNEQSFASWPDAVALSGAELDVLLGALEFAFATAERDTAARHLVRRAQLVIWRKLWPELADQYEDPDSGTEE